MNPFSPLSNPSSFDTQNKTKMKANSVYQQQSSFSDFAVDKSRIVSDKKSHLKLRYSNLVEGVYNRGFSLKRRNPKNKRTLNNLYESRSLYNYFLTNPTNKFSNNLRLKYNTNGHTNLNLPFSNKTKLIKNPGSLDDYNMIEEESNLISLIQPSPYNSSSNSNANANAANFNSPSANLEANSKFNLSGGVTFPHRLINKDKLLKKEKDWKNLWLNN
jgi:hypothetical protein